MSSAALTPPRGTRWADLIAPWLLDPLCFRLLAWVAVPALAVAAIAAPLAAAAVAVLVLLFAALWRRPGLLAILLVVLMGNVKFNYYAGFFTVFPEYVPIVLAAVAWLLHWMEGARRVEERGLMLLFGALLFAGCLSFVDAIDAGRVFAKAVLIGVALVTFYLALEGLRSREDVRRVLRWVEGVALVMALYGILQVVGDIAGFDTSLTFLEKWGNPAFYYGIGAPVIYRLARIFRADSLFNDPNILAGYLAATLPVVMALRSAHGEASGMRGRARFETALLLVLTLCLLLTLSRSGVLAALSGSAVVLWFMPRVLRSVRFWLTTAGGVVGAGALAASLGINPLLILTRLAMTFDDSDFSSQVHRNVFTYGVQLFARHFPTGVGLGNFGLYYGSEVDAFFPNMMTHNAFLSYFAEAGLFGGLAFAALLLAVLMRPWRALHDQALREDRELFAWNAGLLGALVALNVANLFYDYYLRTFIWVFSALAVAAARLWERRAASSA